MMLCREDTRSMYMFLFNKLPSSKNKHATKHFLAVGHPIISSFEPGENWRWCYVDEVML